MVVALQVLASVRQLRAPISSRLTQFLSAKGQQQQQQQQQQQHSVAAAASPRHFESLDLPSPPLPEQEAAALALCHKHHERLRLLFGSADQGEVVAEAVAAAVVKEFCAELGVASTPPAVFVYLFRRYAAKASRVTRHTSHVTRHTSHVTRCMPSF